MKILIAFTLLLLSSQVLSHGGRLAADGCHNEKATGTRHCHGSPKSEAKNNPPEEKKKTEDDYVNAYCLGIVEHRLPDKTRVDCLTDTHAIEYDFARKWAEAVGQSLHYARMTNKQAGIVLIKKRGGQKYVDRINAMITHYNLPITLWVIPAN
jgi:hypothetical protein